jgi:hypothetical protein
MTALKYIRNMEKAADFSTAFIRVFAKGEYLNNRTTYARDTNIKLTA